MTTLSACASSDKIQVKAATGVDLPDLDEKHLVGIPEAEVVPDIGESLVNARLGLSACRVLHSDLVQTYQTLQDGLQTQ